MTAQSSKFPIPPKLCANPIQVVHNMECHIAPDCQKPDTFLAEYADVPLSYSDMIVNSLKNDGMSVSVKQNSA